MSPELVDLWTNGVIQRIDLEPLDSEASRELVQKALGEIDDALDEELWRLAAGNPLVLHEIVEGAAGHTLTTGADGRWTATGQLAASPRLGDLVVSRLTALPDDLREAMEVVALGSPLPVALLDQVAVNRGGLEERGLVAETESGREPMVVAAHPLYGEILKENLGPARQRAAYRRLVDAAIASDGAVDPLRAAVWQLESGTLVSPELGIQGAGAALVRHDPALAEQLVRALPSEDPMAGLILGRALSYQQRFDEAESVLANLKADAPDLNGEIASARAQNLGFGLGRIDEAHQLLAAGVESVVDPQLRGRLMNERAMVLAMVGDFVDARVVTEQVLSDARSDVLARAAAYVTLTLAQGMTGDCVALDEIVADALATADAVAEELPFAGDQVRLMHWVSMISAGRLTEAILESRVRSRDLESNSALRATLLSMYCMTLDAVGRLEEAADGVEEALGIYSEADPFGLEAQARGMLALHRGQQGDTGGAAALEGLALPVPAPRLTVWVDRGRAWTLAADGRVEEAIEVLTNGGTHAQAGEHYVWACFCFHDVVRLGRPEAVIEDIRGLPPMPGAHLVDNMRSHAQALHEGDSGSLSAVAERFASYGAVLLASEAWAQTAGLLVERDALQAARYVLLSQACQSRCQGSDTPALRARPSLITDRESQVALAATKGMTGPQIAEDYFISVRTVDNHLSSVYRKLNIGGREELQGLLAPAMQDEYDQPVD